MSACTLTHTIASKAKKLRTASAQGTPTKGKGTGKGKKTTKKSNKAVTVVSSDSGDLEIDFPHYHPHQPHEVPTELPHSPIHKQMLLLKNNKNQVTLQMI